MSTVKSKNLQIGTDGTASNNFTIYQPGTPDGTLRVGNGNAGSATEIAQFTANGIVMASGKSISGNPPQVTVLTSGTGTYTTPTNCSWLQVRMVAGGGGGDGGNGGGAGGTGGQTTFGTSFLTCNGGTPIAGGTASGGDINIKGGDGAFPTVYVQQGTGPKGGNSPFGGGGGGVAYSNGGTAGSTNSGGGGAGGGGSSANPNGGGRSGGAGGYVEKIITSPSASYSYAVGAGGTGGSAGTGAGAGGAGGSGVIIVTAYFG